MTPQTDPENEFSDPGQARRLRQVSEHYPRPLQAGRILNCPPGGSEDRQWADRLEQFKESRGRLSACAVVAWTQISLDRSKVFGHRGVRHGMEHERFHRGHYQHAPAANGKFNFRKLRLLLFVLSC